MSKNLVIVESPAKAKTIEKFLGADYRVMSSQGHIRDIQPLGRNSMGIDFEHGYAPNYVIDPEKENLIASLRAEVAKADTIWLASDDDREGEAIAWHLYEVLGLKGKNTKRIVFPEITKPVIQDAILHPRDIDYNLVNAQQARRVLDRIIGYDLSPVLWKKITTGLSAGRVQSVAVRLIVEREAEIEQHRTSSGYRVVAEFTGRNPGDASVLRCELNHRFTRKADAQAFLETCMRSDFKIAQISTKPSHRAPAPPFTTSLLQQEAVRKLHFPVGKTMRLAQSLYEAGHITYMRTDSMNLSGLAIATAKEEIIREYGEQYSHPRQYHTTSKGAQEAHEAIRPSYMSAHVAGATADEQKLYDLIWRRTLACQMADAEVEITHIDVTIDGQEYIFSVQGEVVTFDGFTRAYVQSSDDDENENAGRLPRMSVGERLRPIQIDAIQTYNKPPQRYNEATLVRKMEELGIGRPSTYATIIETILQHKYVERGSVQGQKREYAILTLKQGRVFEKTKSEMYGSDPQKLLPTDLGRMTTTFLIEQFPRIMDYGFTAKSEENFDLIAEGKLAWVEDVDTFYQTFHPMLAEVPSGKIAGREIGIDPKSGQLVWAKITRLGPCVQMGDSEGDKKPKFASLKKGQSLYTITLREALELFERQLPYTLCEHDGEAITVGEGKYGPYLRYKTAYASLPKSIDPFAITPEQAVEILQTKLSDSAPIHEWGDIRVLRGSYGPYIKTPRGNFRLPKGTDVDALTKEKVLDIIATAPAPTAKRGKK